MKKRTLSILLAICMVLSVFPIGIFAAETPETSSLPVNMTYELGSESATKINDYNEEVYATSVSLDLLSGEIIRICARGVDEALYLNAIIYGPTGEAAVFLGGGSHSDGWGVDKGFTVPSDGTYTVTVFGADTNVTGTISIMIAYLSFTPFTVREMFENAVEFSGYYRSENLSSFDNFTGFVTYEGARTMPGATYSLYMDAGDRLNVGAKILSGYSNLLAHLYNADGNCIYTFVNEDNPAFLDQTYTATADGTYYLILICASGFDTNCSIELDLTHATSDTLLLDEALDATPLVEDGYFYSGGYYPDLSEYRKIIIDGMVKSAYIAHVKIPADTTVSFNFGADAEYDGEVYVYRKTNGFYAQLLYRDYNNYLSYGEQGSLNELNSEADYYFVFVWDFDPNSIVDQMGIHIATSTPAGTLLESKLRNVTSIPNFLVSEVLTFEESDKMYCGYYSHPVYSKLFVFNASAGDVVYAGTYNEENAEFDNLDVLLCKRNKYGYYEPVERGSVDTGYNDAFSIPEPGTYGIAFIAYDSQYPAGKSFICYLSLPVPAPISIDEYYSYLPITSLATDYSVTGTLDLRTNFYPADDVLWRDVDRYSGGHIKVNLTTGQRISVSAYSETDPDVDTATTVYCYDENGNINYLFSGDFDRYYGDLEYSYGELDNVFVAPKSGTYGIAYGVHNPECSGSTVTFSVRSLGVPENCFTPSETAMRTPVTTLPYSAVVTPGYSNYYYFLDAEDNGGELSDGGVGTAVKADLKADTTVYLTAYRPDPYYDNSSRDTYFYIYRIDETGKATLVDMIDNNDYAEGGERNAEFTPDTDATYLIMTYVSDGNADMEHYIGISTTATPSNETYFYDIQFPLNTTPVTYPITEEFTVTSDRFNSNHYPSAFGKIYVIDVTENTAVNITAEGKDGPVDLRIQYFTIYGNGNYGGNSAYFNENNAEDGKGEDVTVYESESGTRGIFVYTPYETEIGETVTVTITADLPLNTIGDLLDSAVTVTEFPYSDENIIEVSGMYLSDYGQIEHGKFYKIDAAADEIFTVKSQSTDAMGDVDTRIVLYSVADDGTFTEEAYVDDDTLGNLGEEYSFSCAEDGTYYVLVWTSQTDWRWYLGDSYSVSIERIPEPFGAATDVTGALPFEFDYRFSEDDIVTVEGNYYHGRVFKMTMEKDEAVELIFGTADSSERTDTAISVFKETETGRELVQDYDNDRYHGYGERVLFTAPEAGEYYFVLRNNSGDYTEEEMRGYIKSGEGLSLASVADDRSTEISLPYYGSFKGNDVVSFYDSEGRYASGKIFRFTLDTTKAVSVVSYSTYQYSSILVYENTKYGWTIEGESHYQISNGSIGDFILLSGEYCVVIRTQNEETPINVAIEAFDSDADSQALNFTNATMDLADDKWEWTAETKTLTLHDGFELRTVDCAAITLPADSTVIIDGAVRVTSSKRYSFTCDGALTVTAGANGGQLNMDFSGCGFKCDDSDVTLNGLEISFHGFGSFSISESFTANNCNVDINCVNGYKLIESTLGVTFNGGNLKIVSRYLPIYVGWSDTDEVVLNCRYDITMLNQYEERMIGGVIKSDRNAIFYDDADSETPLFEGAVDSTDVTYDTYGVYSVDGVGVRRIVSVLTPPYSLGDVNRDGRVNARDLLQLRLAVAGSITVDEEQLTLANVNCDHLVNARDVLLLRLIISGKTSVNN